MPIFDNPADDIERAFNDMVNFMAERFQNIYNRVDDLGHGLQDVLGRVEDLQNRLGNLETQLESDVTSAIQPLEDKITELENKVERNLPSIPSIPGLGDLSNVTGVSDLVSAVNVVSNVKVLMSMFNGLASFSSAQGTLSQASISTLLTTIEAFVDEIKNVIDKKVPTPAAETLNALLSVIDHSITSVNSFILVIADEDVWKLLNYIQVFGEAIDTMTSSIDGLTNDLKQAPSTEDGAKTISAIIGLAVLVSKGFSELANLLRDIVPLEVGAGGSGGVAAGIEGTIIGKVNVLSIGPATFGTIGFIFSTLANVLEFVKAIVED